MYKIPLSKLKFKLKSISCSVIKRQCKSRCAIIQFGLALVAACPRFFQYESVERHDIKDQFASFNETYASACFNYIYLYYIILLRLRGNSLV